MQILMQLTYDVVCIGIGLRAELEAVETCLASMQIYDNSGGRGGWLNWVVAGPRTKEKGESSKEKAARTQDQSLSLAGKSHRECNNKG